MHDPEECTYVDPNNVEVLAFRDERHVVLPSGEYRTLIGLADEQNTLNERLHAENERLAETNRHLRHAIHMAVEFTGDSLGTSANAALVASWHQYLRHALGDRA